MNRIDNIGQVRFINADNLPIIKACESDFYDLAIIDPPYGIGMSKPAGLSEKYANKRAKRKKINEQKERDWDNQAPPKEFFDNVMRVSKNQIIWGANHFISRMPYDSSGWVLWDKREDVIPERTYADGELAWTSFKQPLRIFRHYWDGFLKRSKEDRIHETQKPVALYEWLLLRYAKPGDRILDTNGGSMSIAIAIDKLNRSHNMDLSLDIIEIDKEYYQNGIERFKNYFCQKTIFDEL